MNIQPMQNGPVYQAPAVDKAQAARGPDGARDPASRAAVPDFDEYVPEDRTGLEHSGFYEPVPGEDGPGCASTRLRTSRRRKNLPEIRPSVPPRTPTAWTAR